MGRQPGWMVNITGRPAMRSPGRPPARRDLERAFWVKIAEGLTSEDAAVAVGVSGPVGTRWFRDRGGMPSIQLTAGTGRFLSFAEREEIALLHHDGKSARHIARVLGRSPSTISRELRRNAATRNGKLEFRASVAQWKAELMARRPTEAKLAADKRLCGSCRTGWPARSAPRTGRSWMGLRWRSRVADMAVARIGGGARGGARSRSPTG